MNKNDYLIRLETTTDHAEVEYLVRESFWNVYRPGYLDGVTVEYATPTGYFVDETEAEEFDKQFPYKEKLKLPGQLV